MVDDIRTFRAAIVGAGPSGLAAALTLARSLQPTIVFDAGSAPRNAASPGIGGLIGRELVTPSDLKSTAREEIDRYGHVRFVDQTVQRIEHLADGGFTLVADDGMTVRADMVLLACGMVDMLPALDGIQRYWGTSIINCPFCHGFELRNRPWGIIVNRTAMVDVAEIYLTWTGDLMLFLDQDIKVETAREKDLIAKGISLERRGVQRLLGDETALCALELDDGTRIEREALVLWPMQRQTDLVATLDLALDADSCIIVDDGYRTAIDGLYAAGDLLYAGHQNVNTAIHMGNLAAATMVLDLSMKSDTENCRPPAIDTM